MVARASRPADGASVRAVPVPAQSSHRKSSHRKSSHRKSSRRIGLGRPFCPQETTDEGCLRIQVVRLLGKADHVIT